MSQRRTATAAIFGVLLASALSIVVPAKAQDRLEAQYRVTMTGVPVGTVIWQVDFHNNLYATSASGGASRVLSGTSGTKVQHLADRRGVIDPLSALRIANGVPGTLSSKSCHQALPIFDGQRRYNLVLTYRRMDKVKLDRG